MMTNPPGNNRHPSQSHERQQYIERIYRRDGSRIQCRDRIYRASQIFSINMTANTQYFRRMPGANQRERPAGVSCVRVITTEQVRRKGLSGNCRILLSRAIAHRALAIGQTEVSSTVGIGMFSRKTASPSSSAASICSASMLMSRAFCSCHSLLR